MRSLTRDEADFVKTLKGKLQQQIDRMRSYPLRTEYPTQAAWLTFGYVHDIIAALTEAIMDVATTAKLAKYQKPLTDLAAKLTADWKSVPYIAPYQRALIQAGAATATPKPMTIFPDDKFIPTMIAHAKDLDKAIDSLVLLWMVSDDLDSQPLLYNMANALNKFYRGVGSNVAEIAETMVKGTARAAGSIFSAFFRSLWKPALIVLGAVLVYKKIDRAEIGPFKGKDSFPTPKRLK